MHPAPLTGRALGSLPARGLSWFWVVVTISLSPEQEDTHADGCLVLSTSASAVSVKGPFMNQPATRPSMHVNMDNMS